MKQKSLEIFIPGPAGRLEAKYYKNPKVRISGRNSASTTPSIWWNNE